MNWQEMPEGKEKYAAYLCSREWSVLKTAVHQRAGGRCERCTRNEIDAVHHLTYARKYREDLDDLQAICNQCHEFVHGKSQYDPREPDARIVMEDGNLVICAGGRSYDFDLSVGVALLLGVATSHDFHKCIVDAEEIASRARISEKESQVQPTTQSQPFRIRRMGEDG